MRNRPKFYNASSKLLDFFLCKFFRRKNLLVLTFAWNNNKRKEISTLSYRLTIQRHQFVYFYLLEWGFPCRDFFVRLLTPDPFTSVQYQQKGLHFTVLRAFASTLNGEPAAFLCKSDVDLAGSVAFFVIPVLAFSFLCM